MIRLLPENFKVALKNAKPHVAPRTATLPVLTHVHLEADRGRLKVSATNLTSAYVGWVGAKIDDPTLNITVPFKTLDELMAKVKRGSVLELRMKNRIALVVSVDGAETTIEGIDAQEFPIIPSPDTNGNPTKFTGLNAAIKAAAPNAATDESRPTLTGIEFEKGKVTATDGFTLSSTRVKSEWPEEAKEFHALVPAKALASAVRAWDEDKPVYAWLNKPHKDSAGHSIFAQDPVIQYWVIQNIDNRFPDWKHVLPDDKRMRFKVEVSAGKLREAIKAVEPIAKKDLNDCTLFGCYNLDDGLFLAVHAKNTKGGKTHRTLAAKVLHEDRHDLRLRRHPFVLTFNIKYALNAMSGFDDSTTMVVTAFKDNDEFVTERIIVLTARDHPTTAALMPVHAARNSPDALKVEFVEQYPGVLEAIKPAPAQVPEPFSENPHDSPFSDETQEPAQDETHEPVAEVAQPVSVEEPAPVTAPATSPSEEEIDMTTLNALTEQIATLKAELEALKQQPAPQAEAKPEAKKKPKNPNLVKAHEYKDHIGEPCPFCGAEFDKLTPHPTRSNMYRATFKCGKHSVNVPAEDAQSFIANTTDQEPAPEAPAVDESVMTEEEMNAIANAEAHAENDMVEGVGAAFEKAMMEAAGH